MNKTIFKVKAFFKFSYSKSMSYHIQLAVITLHEFHRTMHQIAYNMKRHVIAEDYVIGTLAIQSLTHHHSFLAIAYFHAISRDLSNF